MAENVWTHEKTASVKIDIIPGKSDYCKLFREHGVKEGKKVWKVRLEQRDPSRFTLTLHHSSFWDIWVEKLNVAFDTETPRDLLACLEDPEVVIAVRSDTLPGTIDFTSDQDLNTTREVYSVDIITPEDMRHVSIEIEYKTEIDFKNERIVDDFRDLLHSEENADVEFYLKDGVVKAHKLILTTRVAHFKRLFASGMTESQTNTIKMDDYDKEDIRLFLKFVYTGRIGGDYENRRLATLLTIANKYDMRDLFGYCLVVLRRRIPRSKKNVMELVNEFMELSKEFNAPAIAEVCEDELEDMAYGGLCVEPLILAHTHGLGHLKKSCLRYIKSSPQLIGSSGEKLKAYPDLMLEIIKYEDTGNHDDSGDD